MMMHNGATNNLNIFASVNDASHGMHKIINNFLEFAHFGNSDLNHVCFHKNPNFPHSRISMKVLSSFYLILFPAHIK